MARLVVVLTLLWAILNLTKASECVRKPCKNGGTCVNIVGGFQCRCRQGFHGNICDKSCSSSVVDLGILVDGSSSFGKNNYILTKRFLASLVQYLDISSSHTHVGVGYYSNKPQLHAELNDDRLYDPIKLMLSILSLPFPGGESRTDLALKMADEELFTVARGDRVSVPNVLIVISHGRTGRRDATYKKVLRQLKERGIRVIAVGVGKQANKKDLLEMALGEKKQVFSVRGIEELNPKKLTKLIVENSC